MEFEKDRTWYLEKLSNINRTNENEDKYTIFEEIDFSDICMKVQTHLKNPLKNSYFILSIN